MNWFTRFIGKTFGAVSSVKKSLMGAVRAGLGGAFSGAWATDHREEAKHFTGFNYIAIHAIACQIASATVTVFQDDQNGYARQSKRKAMRAAHGSLSRYKSTYGQEDKETDPLPITHPLVALLKKPNPYESGHQFRYKQAQQLRLTGTCFIWNVPSVAGPTCQRYVIPTAMTTPVMPTAEMPYGGIRVQPNASRYIPIDDKGFIEGSPTWIAILNRVIDMRQVQKIAYPHPWWMDDGQSPISAGAKWVDGAEAVDNARTAQLRNGVDPSIAIELPADVEFDQDSMDQYTMKVSKKYGGTDNVGRVMVNLSGTKITPLSTVPKDMAYKEGFEDFKSANLALHQTPPVAVGIQEPGAYAAYYASMKAWRHSAIQPLCDMLAESDTEHLAPQFGEGLTVEIESQEVDDSEQTEKMLDTDGKAGIRTFNEWRTIRGLKPIEGPTGDAFVKFQDSKDKQGNGESDNGFPDKPDEQSKTLKAAMKAARDGDIKWLRSILKSQWITIHGVHVELDDDGKISSGPSELVGQHISSVTGPMKPNAKKPKKRKLTIQRAHNELADMGMKLGTSRQSPKDGSITYSVTDKHGTERWMTPTEISSLLDGERNGKSLGMSTSSGSSGGYLIGDAQEPADKSEITPSCPACGSTNTTHRRATPDCVCGDCQNQFQDWTDFDDLAESGTHVEVIQKDAGGDNITAEQEATRDSGVAQVTQLPPDNPNPRPKK